MKGLGHPSDDFSCLYRKTDFYPKTVKDILAEEET